jgi:serine protease AprX
MEKSKKPRDESEFIKGKIVLQEVIDELINTGNPVNVICEKRTESTIDDVLKLLKELKVQAVDGGHTDYYVFAIIKNLKQVSAIDSHYDDEKRCIHHIWLDKKMKSCVAESQNTINAKPARMLFETEGAGIAWAVLDTGINIGHSYFKANRNCEEKYRKDFSGTGFKDVGKHGTHVAGIIASIAPKVKLYDFKVLGPKDGSASSFIMAMREIRKINFEAGQTVIHGANLSIGGSVPIGSYGCGWSPECQEANRLVASGVVVCVAAGNDGCKNFATVDSEENLQIYPAFTDLGISDPGNAEDVITVGSTHKERPHSYGPSYFSSKGPTGDGRCKPDCLAPGEKIVSADAGDPDGELILDGTSMATPHVSGAVALFLSAKPEFKGQALKVKKILMDSCTDLGRDKYFQGAGLIDLLRMIQSV